MIDKYVTEDQIREQQAKMSVCFEKYQDIFELVSAALQLQIPALITVLSLIICLLIAFIVMPDNLFFYISIALNVQLAMQFIYGKVLKPIVQKLYKKFDDQEQQIQNMQKQICKFIVLCKQLVSFVVYKQKEARNQLLQLSLLCALTIFSCQWSLKVLFIIMTTILFIYILVKALMSNKQIKDKVNESVNASVNFIENKAKEVSKATEKKQEEEKVKEKECENEQPQVVDYAEKQEEIKEGSN